MAELQTPMHRGLCRSAYCLQRQADVHCPFVGGADFVLHVGALQHVGLDVARGATREVEVVQLSEVRGRERRPNAEQARASY